MIWLFLTLVFLLLHNQHLKRLLLYISTRWRKRYYIYVIRQVSASILLSIQLSPYFLNLLSPRSLTLLLLSLYTHTPFDFILRDVNSNMLAISLITHLQAHQLPSFIIYWPNFHTCKYLLRNLLTVPSVAENLVAKLAVKKVLFTEGSKVSQEWSYGFVWNYCSAERVSSFRLARAYQVHVNRWKWWNLWSVKNRALVSHLRLAIKIIIVNCSVE